MFIPRIYYPSPFSEQQTITLDKDASHYINKVLRLKEGAALILFNGEGGEYSAKIVHSLKQTIVQIEHFNNINRESTIHVHLGHGLARSERMDWVVQKTTELGVNEITPLETMRSLVKLEADRKEKRQSHWEKVAISACEQSGRTQIPTLHLPSKLKEWAAQPFDGLSIYFDLTSSTSLKSLATHPHTRIRVAIGPESGWHEEESLYLKQQGFTPVCLGPRILRTETASVTALSCLQALWGDL